MKGGDSSKSYNNSAEYSIKSGKQSGGLASNCLSERKNSENIINEGISRDQQLQQLRSGGFFATEKINLPRGKILLRTSYPSSAAGSLRPSPQKLVLSSRNTMGKTLCPAA